MRASPVAVSIGWSPRAPRFAGPDPDWDFFLPDDDEAYPEPGDFWIEPPDEE